MPLKLASSLLFTTLLASSAHAVEPESAAGQVRTATQQPSPPPANERLVPLVELRSRKYQKLWLGDFHVHDFSVGLTLLSMDLSGAVSVAADPLLERPARDDSIRGSMAYFGIHLNYYVPLVGYTPDFTVGLLPELQVGVGGTTYTETTPRLDAEEGGLGSVLRVPLFAMARLGYNASAYGSWPFCVNLGLGAALLRINTGSPMIATVTYVAPSVRVSVAFHAAELGVETELGEHRDFSSPSDPIRMSYHSTIFTLSARAAPNFLE